MKETQSKYVLLNRKKLTFLIHVSGIEFCKIFPGEWYNEIEVKYHGRIKKYVEKAAMCYGNKSAAEYVLVHYNMESLHQDVPDFHVAKIDVSYEI